MVPSVNFLTPEKVSVRIEVNEDDRLNSFHANLALVAFQEPAKKIWLRKVSLKVELMPLFGNYVN